MSDHFSSKSKEARLEEIEQLADTIRFVISMYELVKFLENPKFYYGRQTFQISISYQANTSQQMLMACIDC